MDTTIRPSDTVAAQDKVSGAGVAAAVDTATSKKVVTDKSRVSASQMKIPAAQAGKADAVRGEPVGSRETAGARNAAMLLISFTDAKVSPEEVITSLGKHAGSGAGFMDGFHREVNNYAKGSGMLVGQVELIRTRLANEQMVALENAIWEKASEQGENGFTTEMATNMGEALRSLRTAFGVPRPDSLPPAQAGEIGKAAVDGFCASYAQDIREGKGSCDSKQRAESGVAQSVKDESLASQKVDKGRKHVSVEFRNNMADKGNIYVADHAQPINLKSKQGSKQAGSSALLAACDKNDKQSLEVSKAIVQLQRINTAKGLLGTAAAKQMSMPMVLGSQGEDVVCKDVKHKFTIAKQPDATVKLTCEADMLPVEVRAGEGSRAVSAKLSDHSYLKASMEITIGTNGSKEVTNLDFTHRYAPEIDKKTSRAIRNAIAQHVRHNPQAEAPVVPTNVGQFVSDNGGVVSAPHQAAGASSEEIGPSLEPVLEGVPGKGEAETALNGDFDLEELTSDVLLAFHGVTAFTVAQETQDVQFGVRCLASLASAGGNTEESQAAFDRSFYHQINEHEGVLRRTYQPAMVALEQALHEGLGAGQIKNRQQIAKVLSHSADQLTHIRTTLGGFSPSHVEVTDVHRNFARGIVDSYVSELDAGISQTMTTDRDPIVDRALSSSELGKLKPDSEHAHVCGQFLNDAAAGRWRFVVSGEPNRWLVNPASVRYDNNPQLLRREAAAALLEICGGNEEQCLQLSRAISKPTVDALAPASAGLKTAGQAIAFTLKPGENGEVGVSATMLSDLQTVVSKDMKLVAVNPNFSYSDVELQFEVTDDARVKHGFSRLSVNIVPQLTMDRAGTGGMNERPARVPMSEAQRMGSELAGMRTIAEIPVENDIYSMDADQEQMVQLSQNADQLLEQIDQVGGLSARQKQELRDRLEFISDTNTEIERAIDHFEVTGDGSERIVELAANFASDSTLLYEDILMKAEQWSTGSNLTGDQRREVAATVGAVAMSLRKLSDTIAPQAADIASAVADVGGDLSSVSANSHYHRALNANLQGKAMYAAVDEALGKARKDGVDTTEARKELLDLIDARVRSSGTSIASAENGGLLDEYGAGMKQSKFESNIKTLTNSIVPANKGLPRSHPELNERQLLTMWIELYAEQSPAVAPYLADLQPNFHAQLENQINTASWRPISVQFHDRQDGTLFKMQSDIVPARHMEEAGLKSSYGGKAVSSHSRMNGMHVSNLAQTKLSAGNQGELFRGLRHGILDSYKLTEKNLRTAPDSMLQGLHVSLLKENPAWKQLIKTHEAFFAGERLALMRSPEGSKFIASTMREKANDNAAKELVHAAVANNPSLLAKAQAGLPVELNLNSISMVTPDYLRKLLPGVESERTMQQNQRAALAKLGDAPVQITVSDKKGKSVTVPVTVTARSFNFPVNEFATNPVGLRRLLQPFMGWDDADKQNLPLLEQLVGNIKSDEVGGAAGAMLGDPSKMPPLDTDDPNGSAFADPQVRATAIRTLSLQIKQMFRDKAHRTAGNEPYKMVTRLTLLSHLMGDQTAFNCKSGNDRTGMLDAEVKMLAASASRGFIPEPNAVADPLRKTNYVLKTGNLQMQQYNTGLSGYRLVGIPALLTQLSSPFARSLYLGDSDVIAA